MDLTWETPKKTELSAVADFITSEGKEVHPGFGGASQLNFEKRIFVPNQPYLQLAQVLCEYINQNLHIPFEGEFQRKTVDTLCEEIMKREKEYHDRVEGRWHSIWYKMGEQRDTLEGWVALIPDDYGLAVVKTGLAVLFKLSQDSAEKRDKIFNTFAELRDALIRADPRRTSFRDHRDVSDCTDCLYRTVVDSIQEMIILTSKEKRIRSKFNTKFKHRDPLPDPDIILQKITDQTKAFERAVGWARDQTIDTTGKIAQYVAVRSDLTNIDVKNCGARLEQLADEARSYIKRRDQQDRDQQETFNQIYQALEKLNTLMVRERESGKEANKLNNRNLLIPLLLERKSMKTPAENRGQLRQTRTYSVTWEIRPEQFCQILAQPNSFSSEPPDIERSLQHPNGDLAWVLMQRGSFKAKEQGQAQSLILHTRFLSWMKSYESDLILVDANISASGLQRVSAISLFCGSLITTLLEIEPDEVVVYFFCGLHLGIRDPWYGPNGLVRSISMQLFMKLVELQILDMEFVDERDYLQALEKHDLSSLCQALVSLVSQFPPETAIFCLIDSISCFDRDSTFRDLKVVIAWLQGIVEDPYTIPNFKVLLISPLHSTLRMKLLPAFSKDLSRCVSLSSHNSNPNPITNRTLASQLLRPSTPIPPVNKQEMYRTMKRGNYEVQYEDDQGWQSE